MRQEIEIVLEMSLGAEIEVERARNLWIHIQIFNGLQITRLGLESLIRLIKPV